jgi:membrane fusion protein (multidrug efflux system)
MSEQTTTITTTSYPEKEVKAAPLAKAAPSGKKKILTIVGSLAAIGVLYFTYQYIFYVTTDNAQIMANTAILTARSSGFVTKVNVQEGQRVKAGEVLVEINSKDYKSMTDQSENELGSLSAKLRDAQINYERLNNLFKAGAVSQQQRDSAFANYQELAQKKKALQSQVELSESGLADTQLKAPSDGTIARKSAEVGMLASPGTPLIGFVSDESRWVVANFKETDLNRLKVGQKVNISVDAISGREFEGTVESFYPSTGSVFSLLPPDNATGNFTKVVQRVPTRIAFKNISKDDIQLLKAGLSVEVDVRVR